MGKRNKGKGSSSSRVRLIDSNLIELNILGYICAQETIKISRSQLENSPGKTIVDKLTRICGDELKRKNPSAEFITDLKFRPVGEKDRNLLSEFTQDFIKKEEEKKEENKEYIGEIIGDTKKKIVSFKYSEIKDIWKQQKELWGNWKEFIRVFLDDIQDDSQSEDLEPGDIVNTYTVLDEIIIRKKLLKDYPEDYERLGFTKREPQT